MWTSGAPLPRSKSPFFVVTNKGAPIMVKPGKALFMNEGKWISIPSLSPIYHKSQSVFGSSSGIFSVHLPKTSPSLAIHQNKPNTVLYIVPLPPPISAMDDPMHISAFRSPENESLLLFSAYPALPNCKPPTFSESFNSVSISDSGKSIVASFNQSLYFYHQLPEYPFGNGQWLPLPSSITVPNHPNSPFLHSSSFAFDSPDEGVGAISLTAVLPPCRPFDTIYLYTSVFSFNHTFTLSITHSELSLPIISGKSKPKFWWSPHGKLLVVYVSDSLIILSRLLRIISILPISEVFDGSVTSLAWSCGGHFFVLTSDLGEIGAVSSKGLSLRHQICDLPKFEATTIAVTPDSNDQFSFCVYSQSSFRVLKVDYIEQQISKSLFDLLHTSDIEEMFRYHSPNRFSDISAIEAGIQALIDGPNSALAYFAVRFLLSILRKPFQQCFEVLNLLSASNSVRERILFQILDDEMNKRDWVTMPSSQQPQIVYYGSDSETDFIYPDSGRDIDISVVTSYVRGLIYDEEISCECPVNYDFLFGIMVELGRYDRAIAMSKAEGVIKVFSSIVSRFADDAASIYRAMITCIKANPKAEDQIRAIAISAIVNILKQMIVDCEPPNYLSKLCAIEESVEVPIPENSDQMKDFAVVIGICLLCAGFPSLSNFFNGRSSQISNQLKDPVRDIIRILWFIRFRYEAFRGNNDALLRVLEFPELINLDVVKMEIEKRSGFSDDVYKLYMTDKAKFENDPLFIDFICECSSRITQRLLDRMDATVSGQIPRQTIEKSPLVVAAIVSHMVPWLRSGIPCAMASLKIGDLVPNELISFEDFNLHQKKAQKMEIIPLSPEEIPPDFEVSEELGKTEIPPKVEKSIEENELSEGEEVPVLKADKKKQRKKANAKPKKREHPKLKLLDVDRSEPQRGIGFMVQPVPIIQGIPYVQPVLAGESLRPIWDIDPALYAKGGPPDIPLKKARIETETQYDIRKLPERPGANVDQSSSISEFSIEEPATRDLPRIDPFPLDQALRQRVEDLLKEDVPLVVPPLPSQTKKWDRHPKA